MVYIRLPVVTCHSVCLLALVASTPTTATLTSSPESITSQLWNQLSWKKKLFQTVSWEFLFFLHSFGCKSRTKVFANTVLKHYSWTTFMKTVGILRTSYRSKCLQFIFFFLRVPLFFLFFFFTCHVGNVTVVFKTEGSLKTFGWPQKWNHFTF